MTENVATTLAKGDAFLFLNSDIEVHPNWIDPAVELMESNDQIGVVGIKLTFPPNDKGEVTIQSCGGLYDAGRMPFHRYLGWLADDPRVNKTERVSWVTGAALLTRKDVFEKVGGFDPVYGKGYFDDPDYCERVKGAGFEIWYCAEASATHLVGKSMSTAVKTPEQNHQAGLNFYHNARLFESRWSEKITPDVNYIAVNY